MTVNLPLAAGTAVGGYLDALSAASTAIEGFSPDAPLIVSLGFDTFERDPIGDLAIRTGDYAEIGGRVAALGMPTIVLQEGGYAIDAIGANAVSFFGGVGRTAVA